MVCRGVFGRGRWRPPGPHNLRRAAALPDVCPHRKYPLSLGRVVGEETQCLYHGARFDHNGTCTQIPGQQVIPRSFDLGAFACDAAGLAVRRILARKLEQAG